MKSTRTLFGSLSVLCFVILSTAYPMPESDLPFEFSRQRGSVVTDDNVLTQAVSNDAGVFKTDEPQPIKKYNSFNSDSKINSGNGNNKINSNNKTNGGKYTTTTQTSQPGHNNGNKQSYTTRPQGNNKHQVYTTVYESPNKQTYSSSSPTVTTLTSTGDWDFFNNPNQILNQFLSRIGVLGVPARRFIQF